MKRRHSTTYLEEIMEGAYIGMQRAFMNVVSLHGGIVDENSPQSLKLALCLFVWRVWWHLPVGALVVYQVVLLWYCQAVAYTVSFFFWVCCCSSSLVIYAWWFSRPWLFKKKGAYMCMQWWCMGGQCQFDSHSMNEESSIAVVTQSLYD
jgi:hypothetical protein